MENSSQRQPEPPRGKPAIISDYALLPGVPDEMLDPGGNIRPTWAPLIEAFDQLGLKELNTRFEPPRARSAPGRWRTCR
jgi:hypothetical protein